MPDYSAEIAELEQLLNSATKSVSTDGLSTQFDLAEARQRLKELRRLDTSTLVKRPAAYRMDLGGAF